MSGGYLQISANPNYQTIGQDEGGPGQFAGCYWNRTTVTAPSRFANMQQVTSYLLGGRQRLSNAALDPCPGCVMPRLIFDVRSGEMGMDPILLEEYFTQRKYYLGY